MPNYNKISPRDKGIDKRMMALGVAGFLLLAAAFFYIGYVFIGQKLRPQSSGETAQEEMYIPPRSSRPVPPDLESKPAEPPLDLEITEQGAAKPDDTAADNGVSQSKEGLTVTLDPTENGEGTPSRSEESSSKPNASVDKPKKQPSPPVSDAHADASGRLFMVQAGTFTSKSNAYNLASDLHGRGYDVHVKTVQMEGRTLYRVQMGAYRSKTGAEKLVKELSSKGYTPSIILEPKS
jgi:cell division protein FtsN